jgi:hypothetical protein
VAVPNYTYLKLKMPGPKGVIIIEGSFEQAYYYEQDCVMQTAAQITPCAPDSPGHDIGRAPPKEATKAAVVLDQPSTGKATKAPSGCDGSASPSI